MAPRRSEADIYVATETGSALVDGELHTFRRGVTRVRAGHPLLKQARDYFKPVEDAVHYDVEQMTAAPGEKRGQQSAATDERRQG